MPNDRLRKCPQGRFLRDETESADTNFPKCFFRRLRTARATKASTRSVKDVGRNVATVVGPCFKPDFNKFGHNL